MFFFSILLSIKAIMLGAIYGRLDGGGLAKVSEWVERSLIMFFFVLACAPFAGLWSLLAYLGVVGIATGHGQYFLSRAVKYIDPERTDFITTLIFGKDPRTNKDFKVEPNESIVIREAMSAYGDDKLYLRCLFGMFVTGTLVGLPAVVLALVFNQWFVVLLLSLTGVVKAFSYHLGYKYFNQTVTAEYFNGGSRTALCVAAIWTLVGWINCYGF